MIARRFWIYDLQVLIMYGEASYEWCWIVRTQEDNYQVEQQDGRLYHFVSRRGFAMSEQDALITASTIAVRTARARVKPFAGRYLDRLLHWDQLGIGAESVEELP